MRISDWSSDVCSSDLTYAHPACSAGVVAAWVVPGSATVRFVRREGWARSETAIYDWDSGRDTIRRRYATTALLIDCQPRDRRQLICLRETSLKPRHLAAIDLDRGRAHIIAD